MCISRIVVCMSISMHSSSKSNTNSPHSPTVIGETAAVVDEKKIAQVGKGGRELGARVQQKIH